MPLPKEETPEFEQILNIFQHGTTEENARLAKELGYASRSSFEGRLREKGYHKIKPQIPTIPNLSKLEGKQIEINLPPIKLREYKSSREARGEKEIAILHTCDGHAGRITPSYNEDVYQSRMDTLFDSVMKIISLHRKMYDIDTLRILDLGDNVQGEEPEQGGKVGNIKMGVRDQVTKLAFPTWIKLICSLKQEFKEVIFDGFPGNHGYERLAPETSRADIWFYDLLAAKLNTLKNITINIHENFGDIVYIEGFGCFCFHGDGIPSHQGVPFFAIDRRLKAWHMQYGGFNYAFGGHFHKHHSDEISSRLTYFMAGSLVSDDDWALKKIGISSNPSQNIYGMHPRHGITWRYNLIVDNEFLPSEYKQGNKFEVDGQGR